MGKPGLTDKDMGYARTMRALDVLNRKAYVVVGIRGEKGAERYRAETEAVLSKKTGKPTKRTRRVAKPSTDPDALTLVEVATVHEFGSEDGRVPERSYLRATFDRRRDAYYRVLKGGLERVIDGETHIDQELDLLGMRVAGDTQRTITQITSPPLAQSTIDRKGSSKPLIDTGRLLGSIDSEVRRDD